MNYTRIYWNFIKSRLKRDTSNFYTEEHHIIPLCKNGPDRYYNHIKLTPREHMFAHMLLVKIYGDTMIHPCDLKKGRNSKYIGAHRIITNAVSRDVISDKLKEAALNASFYLKKLERLDYLNNKYLKKNAISEQVAKQDEVISIKKLRKKTLSIYRDNIKNLAVTEIINCLPLNIDENINFSVSKNLKKTIQTLKAQLAECVSLKEPIMHDAEKLSEIINTSNKVLGEVNA